MELVRGKERFLEFALWSGRERTVEREGLFY